MKFWATLKNAFNNVILPTVVGFAAYTGLVGYDDMRLTATTMVGLGGTLIGFMMTALSIMVSASDRRFMENIRRTGHYQNLVTHIINTASIWLLVVAMGLIGHFVVGESQRIVLAVSAAILSAAMVQLVAVGSKFRLIIKQLSR